MLPNAPDTRDSQPGALGQAGALRGNQRGIRCHNGDDGASPLFKRVWHGNLAVWNGLANRYAVDLQTLAASVVGLHQHANRVATRLGADHARSGANPALETVTDHAGS